ncbi:MAG: M55 family metallopeptidase [Clostridia bacterium]|nr:M55 family metallopeptidase [Clostridia bacterium]
MKKLFISADIEGTCGIAHWDEANRTKSDYAYFVDQMTREVAAAAQGAIDGGMDEVLVKDGHGSARNINPRMLPRETRMFRGWACHPYSMMFGIDGGFDGCAFTGYHSAASINCNPLSHTMNGGNNFVKINGEIASELMINCLTAAYNGVPVYFVAGDKGLCEWIRSVNPNISVVATNEGFGNGTFAIHPDVALEQIHDVMQQAVSTHTREECMFPMPEHFTVEINFKDVYRARVGGFYPGCEQVDSRTVRYECDDWFDVLRFFSFVL